MSTSSPDAENSGQAASHALFWTKAEAHQKKLDYHFEEFKALKSEIAELVKSTNAHLTYALLASGAIYSWLLTTKCGEGAARLLYADPATLSLAWLIPLFVTAGFAFLSGLSHLRINQMGAYIAKLEEHLAILDPAWEKTLTKPWWLRLSYAVAVMWALIAIANGAVAYHMWGKPACVAEQLSQTRPPSHSR